MLLATIPQETGQTLQGLNSGGSSLKRRRPAPERGRARSVGGHAEAMHAGGNSSPRRGMTSTAGERGRVSIRCRGTGYRGVKMDSYDGPAHRASGKEE